MPPYPRWRYFPAHAPPPDWVAPLVARFTAVQKQIDSAVTFTKRMDSDAVLSVLADGLNELDFVVEKGKKKTRRDRPNAPERSRRAARRGSAARPAGR